ncbi:hypothetical protein AVEN_130956-1 [Araneus ventricosus]|uniref:Uncharacterized protein n=1 Tax=Araneus ventricosus TaxID=182803 RepID=A0A4Y2VXY6_ARAVE|nr:hypothetical protein AVEN_130956-1 [Araneus ventricosus]
MTGTSFHEYRLKRQQILQVLRSGVNSGFNVNAFVKAVFLFSTSDRAAKQAEKCKRVVVWKTVNAAVSCQTLRRLQRAILIFGVVLNHDNARTHTDVVTQQFLKKFKRDVSDQPAYSPDLATSDFHLFPELKN